MRTFAVKPNRKNFGLASPLSLAITGDLSYVETLATMHEPGTKRPNNEVTI